MSFRGDALWNNPISGGSSLRNAGASTLSNSFNRTPSQNSLAQTQQQYTTQQQPQQTQPTYASPTDYVENDEVDYDIYNKAISVSSPRLAGVEGDENPGIVRKKVIRRVEVPFTRQVKVPTQTTQLVPTLVEQKIPVKKLVAVPGYKLVDEEYTEYEERESIREKEVWVKKIVPERYIEKVPVHKIRQIQKPTTVIKEVESYETVQVPTNKRVMVDGYRVDQVQDSKVVEVEEYQDYELRPHPIGPSQISNTQELGRLPNSRLSRNIGSTVYSKDHPKLNYLDADENAGENVSNIYGRTGQIGQIEGRPNVTQNFNNTQTQQNSSSNNPNYTNSFYRPSSPSSQQLNIHGTSSTQSQNLQQYGAFQGTSGSATNDPRSVLAAGGYRKPAQKSTESNENVDIGISVDDTHTRHTDGTGVSVTKVVRGGMGARAGIQPHDIITAVNGVPSSTVDEYNGLLMKSRGPLSFSINRDGRRNVQLTLYR